MPTIALVTRLEPGVVVAALSLIGVLAGVGGALLGTLITRGTETRKLIGGAPSGYAQLVEDLQQERAELRGEVRTLGDELASMRTRLRGLETGQDTDRRLIEALRAAYTELRRYVRSAGLTPPPVPAGLGVDDSGDHTRPVSAP